MKTLACLKVYVMVEANADTDRKTLSNTIGAWIEALPSEFTTIETTNADGSAMTIKVTGCYKVE